MEPKLRFKCNKNSSCVNCGECCKFREKQFLHEEDDKILRQKIYENMGIIFIYPLYKFTITLTPEEKKIFEKEAKLNKIKLKILPKRIAYNSEKKSFEIINYFPDHNICPFFDKKHKLCTIYELRPKQCRDFPNFDLESEKKTYSKIDDNLSFEEVVKQVKKWLKE